MPLLDTLTSYGHGHYSNHRFFDHGSLFWSLTRLFQGYYRVMTICIQDPSNKNRHVFLEADIEMFIIWLRVVMNDVAYIIRQVLPPDARSLKGPKGSVPPLNREMSIHDLLEFTEKNPDLFPELTTLLSSYSHWIKDLRKERDQIVHYKGRVQTFSFEEGVGFAVMDPADSYSTYTPTPEGGEKIGTRPVRNFIHEQTKALYKFMNEDMVDFLNKYIQRNGHKMSEIFGPQMGTKMCGAGFDLFANIIKNE